MANIRLRDVAEAAGVSQGTASNVWNRPEVVRAEVREHVREVAARLGYSGPDQKGRLLRAGKVGAIGVATTEPLGYFFDDPWARALLAELSHVCDARGAGVALVSAQNRERAAWNVESAVVDGFVLLCVEGDGELLVRLTRRRGLPFVALSLDRRGDAVPSVGIDNRGGARAAGAHLAALGHRRVGILGIDVGEGGEPRLLTEAEVRAGQYQSTRDRALGYWEGLAAAGVGPEAAPVFDTRGEAAGVEVALATLLDGAEPPTALLCMSDRVALLALAGLRARGLRVPEDVSVVGFDGVPEGEGSSPPLTTVAQPLAALAARAVEAILDDRMPAGPEVMPVSLLVRASSGAPPPSG